MTETAWPSDPDDEEEAMSQPALSPLAASIAEEVCAAVGVQTYEGDGLCIASTRALVGALGLPWG